jgi:hypothetical protein
MKTVIYPIANGNYTDSNVELLMSLRSLESNLIEEFQVIVISEREPMYLSDEVMFVKCDGYRHALQLACTLADDFLWMNDDIIMLKPHTWDDLKQWARADDQVSDERIDKMCDGSGWSKKKGMVLRKLKEEGRTTFDYSTHLPYHYESEALSRILSDPSWDFGYKTPVETAYGNVVEVERRMECEKLSRHHDRHLPVDVSSYHFLNYADNADLPHVRGFLLGMFPVPCKFEDYGKLNPANLTLDQVK